MGFGEIGPMDGDERNGMACSIRYAINKTTTCQMHVNYSHFVFLAENKNPWLEDFKLGMFSKLEKI